MADRVQAYEVTGKAGQWVAGRRAKAGDVLMLTSIQAEHEVRVGSLRTAGVAKAVSRDKAAKE